MFGRAAVPILYKSPTHTLVRSRCPLRGGSIANTTTRYSPHRSPPLPGRRLSRAKNRVTFCAEVRLGWFRSAVRYAAKGKTEVEEGGGGGLNISVQLTVVDLGQLVYRSLQCQCTMSRARLCPEGHLLNLYAC